MLQRGVPMLVAFLGYLLLGLGPGAVLFLSIPARRPFLVILTFARCAPRLSSCACEIASPLQLPVGRNSLTDGEYSYRCGL